MSARRGFVALAVVAAAIVAIADPLGGPEPAPVRFVFVLALASLAAFVVVGVRRLLADANVVDSHPGEELPLIRDAQGRADGFEVTVVPGVSVPTPGPPGFEKGLEAMAKDLVDDDR